MSKTDSLLPPSLQEGINIIRGVVKTLPNKSGVYRMINKRGEILYIGKAKNLKNRVVSYTQPERLPNRLKRMVSETISMEIVVTHSEVEALLLESSLIKKLQPKYNILLKDDKSFPHLYFNTQHPFPRVAKHRGPQREEGRYFGPFASNLAVNETLILLQKIFLLRNCTDTFFQTRTRPCLQYHIKRCSAPCVGKIDPKTYGESVKEAIRFIQGKSNQVQKRLAEKMHKASEALDFEKAALYRDKIALMTRLTARQRVHLEGIPEVDVIALFHEGDQVCIQVFFFRHGQNFGNRSFFLIHSQDSSPEEQVSAFINQFYAEHSPPGLLLMNYFPEDVSLIRESFLEKYGKSMQLEVPKIGKKAELVEHAYTNAREALQRRNKEQETQRILRDALGALLELSHTPERIEAYDNSHFQGTNPYGVMIVFDETGFNKKAYRQFAIKTPAPDQGGDDYAMMREVLFRRFKRSVEGDWPLPEVILIDGGKGQLKAALEARNHWNIEGITLVGIAKGEDRHAGRERFFLENGRSFTLPLHDPLLHFLQRIRDESHRFAIKTHRAGRERSTLRSKVDQIPGVGPKRKKALLEHFGSLRNMEAASIQDFCQVPGINRRTAEDIFKYFHGAEG